MATAKTPPLRNKFERKIWNQVKHLRDAKYEPVKFTYTITSTYLPDFSFRVGDKIIFVEAKGEFDATARRKMAAVKKQHPKTDIRIVFYKANQKLNKRAKMTYGEWATKHGYLWADGEIPKGWLK